ncbi:MAG: Ppx/GppA family phosphatase [Aquificae bacterium]|nr:Ppx/GppA family phosphatase [Aquificota bacterium]
MRIASVDVGSYSVRMSVWDLSEGKPKPILERGHITALGSKVKQTGLLQEERIKETLRILKEFKKETERLGVREVLLVGTEALRRAKNADEFIARVKEETGWELKVISPQEEGRLAYLSAVCSLGLSGRNCVIDQGGGSTEYIFGEGKNVGEIISLPFGIVNLTETFLKHDPPTDEEIRNLLSFLEKEIKKVKREVDNVVGLGGTITTLVALEYNVYPYDPKKVHGKKLTLEQIRKWFETLRRLPAKERSKLYPPIEDRRAQVILAGIAIFLKTLELFGKEELIVSDWGLREGVLISRLLDENHTEVCDDL